MSRAPSPRGRDARLSAGRTPRGGACARADRSCAEAGRVLLGRRAVGLRQVHFARCRRRPRQAERRHDPRSRASRSPARCRTASASCSRRTRAFPGSRSTTTPPSRCAAPALPTRRCASASSSTLAFTGLASFAQAYPAQLSGGMRQRLCIARTLVMRPRMLLLDEPFGALDQQTRLLMGDELLKLWRETGATILLITHSLDEAALLSDRIGVMSARPGVFIDLVETGWARERDSRIVSQAAFGEVTGAALVGAARPVDQGARDGVMTRAGLIRLALILGALALLEWACRYGYRQPRGGHSADHDAAGRLARARLGGDARRNPLDLAERRALARPVADRRQRGRIAAAQGDAAAPRARSAARELLRGARRSCSIRCSSCCSASTAGR